MYLSLMALQIFYNAPQASHPFVKKLCDTDVILFIFLVKNEDPQWRQVVKTLDQRREESQKN